MRLPPVQPRSRRAHEAAHWARAQGRFDDYNGVLFRALFERGEDIGQPDVLLKLAGDLELDADSLGDALETREFEASVIAEEREAEELGLSGVPAMVADRRVALTGVQSLAGLRELVNRARAMKMNKTEQ
jgi:predicted DsbA family dithiol-disulfide isomerase